MNDHDVRLLTDSQRSDAFGFMQIFGSVCCCHSDRFQWSQAGFDQQFDVSQVAKPRYGATVSSRIQPRHQESTRAEKGTFKFHLLLEENSGQRVWVFDG